jgi:hypothetical protein
MKQILVIIVALFLLSCGNNTTQEAVTNNTSAIDSLIMQSSKNLDSIQVLDKKTDSATKKTIVKIVREIRYLNDTIKYLGDTLAKYREILSTQTVSTEKVVYKIDTVYIETKKSFWGKQKTNTTVKSDSVITEKTDIIEKVDTTGN